MSSRSGSRSRDSWSQARSARARRPLGRSPPVPAGSGGVLVRPGETPPLQESQAVIDRVVAVVNGDAIMMSELQEAVVLARPRWSHRARGRRSSRCTMLNRLIDHRLQVQEAKREQDRGER